MSALQSKVGHMCTGPTGTGSTANIWADMGLSPQGAALIQHNEFWHYSHAVRQLLVRLAECVSANTEACLYSRPVPCCMHASRQTRSHGTLATCILQNSAAALSSSLRKFAGEQGPRGGMEAAAESTALRSFWSWKPLSLQAQDAEQSLVDIHMLADSLAACLAGFRD